ncbi:hypothetical protein FIBSPDRAFT_1050007 [Athelia psychrophila]|uniref:Cytochrome P450 n=1 Tax=Athelia psychrophila TaxID=1759441 RepID=A0A166BCE5_9AGAM|nr:hypothetical protein FIBSPDRAFT_1050007 [Fibularhizoctonia sp. CBS 109695]
MMCQLFLHKPHEFDDHIRLYAIVIVDAWFNREMLISDKSRTAGRLILLITHGLSVETTDNEYITIAGETMKLISDSTLPGSYLVDIFPQSRSHIFHSPPAITASLTYTEVKRPPRWIPFTGFFREAEIGRATVSRFISKPFLAVKKQMASMLIAVAPDVHLSLQVQAAALAIPSIAHAHDLLTEDDLHDMSQQYYEKHVKWMCGSLYGVSVSQTYSTLLTFIALLAMHPEKQKPLQE